MLLCVAIKGSYKQGMLCFNLKDLLTASHLKSVRQEMWCYLLNELRTCFQYACQQYWNSSSGHLKWNVTVYGWFFRFDFVPEHILNVTSTAGRDLICCPRKLQQDSFSLTRGARARVAGLMHSAVEVSRFQFVREEKQQKLRKKREESAVSDELLSPWFLSGVVRNVQSESLCRRHRHHRHRRHHHHPPRHTAAHNDTTVSRT